MNATQERFYRKHGPAPFAAGAVIGGLTILAKALDAPTIKDARWRVRYACCGLETTRGYPTLLAFLNDPPSQCERCARREPKAKRRRGRPVAPLPVAAPVPAIALVGINPATLWPRPPSLVGQAPGIWGVQP